MMTRRERPLHRRASDSPPDDVARRRGGRIAIPLRAKGTDLTMALPTHPDDINAAYSALIECALWSSLALGPDESYEPIPADEVHDEGHIPLEVRAELRDDVAAFMLDNADDLQASGLSIDQIGHDFWLTREGHGAGFWDRGLGIIGDRLTEAAKVYGGVDLQLYYRLDAETGEPVPQED